MSNSDGGCVSLAEKLEVARRAQELADYEKRFKQTLLDSVSVGLGILEKRHVDQMCRLQSEIQAILDKPFYEMSESQRLILIRELIK